MSGRIVIKVGDVTCLECGNMIHQHLRHFEQPDTLLCPKCKGKLITFRTRNSILPGHFSDNINSDLYWRPDRDNYARELEWQYHKFEKLEEEGKTPKVNDYKTVRAAIETAKRFPEYYGDYDKGKPVAPDTKPIDAPTGETSKQIFEKIREVVASK